MKLQCTECGCEIEAEEERWLNEGTTQKRAICQNCHEALWDNGKIISCESCCEWYDLECIRAETIFGNTFAECPHCHRDIVDGYTKEEHLEEYGGKKMTCTMIYTLMHTWDNADGTGGTVLAASEKPELLREQMHDALAEVRMQQEAERGSTDFWKDEWCEETDTAVSLGFEDGGNANLWRWEIQHVPFTQICPVVIPEIAGGALQNVYSTRNVYVEMLDHDDRASQKEWVLWHGRSRIRGHVGTRPNQR
ncbi:hypothetical protein [Agathobaculum desmolans]|uniref:hypothetical protein n=1 Tax=Agathobaculum desmolans TaxID=39484 RepID=UPI00248ED828|nr:hypothetical protein [Agathobaculum desmolans]